MMSMNNVRDNLASEGFDSRIDLKRLRSSVLPLREKFRWAVPFRYVVIDDFLFPRVAREAASLFPPYHQMERVRDSVVEKRASESRLERLDPIFEQIFADLRGSALVSVIEEITGFEQLAPPNILDGAGLHQACSGGFHNVHADKNIDSIGLFHRLSLIIYLNDGWKVGSPGALELWDRKMQRCVSQIEPLFNRCVLFEVHDRAYHGYRPLSLAEGETRKSLAMWYLSPVQGNDQDSTPRAVRFYTRPDDSVSTRAQHALRELSLKLPPPARRALLRLKRPFRPT